MATSKVTYIGDLRTEMVHLKSGQMVITDAPVDNNGKGEYFSPTDLVATALASCMLTIIGLTARNYNINIEGTTAEVTKIMESNPRRIGEIDIEITFVEGLKLTDKDKTVLERAGNTCPVFKSLNPEMKKVISFIYK